MAAKFVNASSQQLLNSATPITATPFSVGFWVSPDSLGVTRTPFSISDAAVNNYWSIRQSNTDAWSLIASETTADLVSAGTVTADAYHFIVARFISSTSRWLSILHPAGDVAHVQGTTIKAPAAVTQVNIGSLAVIQFFGGLIGEYWIAGSDIQADGAQLKDNLLRQLAYGGPFSVPSIAKDIIEYRSFRKHPTSAGNEASEVYFGGAAQAWTNTNGVTIGPHPPLPYWYVKPGQTRTELVI